jgi:flagellar protein FliL
VEEEEVKLEEETGGKSNKGLMIFMAVQTILVLAALGGVAFFILNKAPDPVPAAAAKEGAPEAEEEYPAGDEAAEEGDTGSARSAGGQGPMEKIDDLVIQLRNPEFDRYVKISFELELKNERDVDVVRSRQAQIRDAIISYLSDRTYEELRGSSGLQRVKVALTKKVNQIVKSERVRALYITDFVVQ